MKLECFHKEKLKRIAKRIAKKRKKTKTAIILEAIDEKPGWKESQKGKILRLAG